MLTSCYVKRELFDAIVNVGSSYVTGMREDSVFEVVEERMLSEEALAANVVRDAIVRLGDAKTPAHGGQKTSGAVRAQSVLRDRTFEHPSRPSTLVALL
jgi:hypothetical protein